MGGGGGGGAPPSDSPPKPDRAAGRAAFETVRAVFQHPRCQNCHPDGDVPLQGDDGRLHNQHIRRGPKGEGMTGARKVPTGVTFGCLRLHYTQILSGQVRVSDTPGQQIPDRALKLTPVWRSPLRSWGVTEGAKRIGITHVAFSRWAHRRKIST
jgi:hypothetical protein